MQELIIFKLTSYKKFIMSTFFEQDDIRRREMARITGVYLPLDMNADIESVLITRQEDVPEDVPQVAELNHDNMAKLARKLHLEECRSSSFRRSYLKERQRSKVALLKLLILRNDVSSPSLKYALPDRIFSPFSGKSIEDYILAIKKEKIWSSHYFREWMMARRQRQKLEWEITL